MLYSIADKVDVYGAAIIGIIIVIWVAWDIFANN